MSKSFYLYASGHLQGLLDLIKFAREEDAHEAKDEERKPKNKEEVLSELFGRDGSSVNGASIGNILIKGKSRKVFTEDHFRNFRENFEKRLSDSAKDIGKAENYLEKQENRQKHAVKLAVLVQRRAGLDEAKSKFRAWATEVAAHFASLKKNNDDPKGKKTHIRKTAQVKKKKVTEPDFETVKSVLTSFHEKVGAGNYSSYRDAWELLHPDFKERAWGGEVDLFINGYINSHAIKEIHVFHITRSSAEKIECKIYYEQELTVSHSPDLAFLQSATVANIERVTGIVNELRVQLKGIGAKKFENMELYRLFEALASEYIWYKYQISPKDILKVLHIPKPIKVNRLFHCACVLTEGKWLISRIRRHEIASVR